MQKTAYEMRISDWSSDESSSDHVPGLSAGNIVALAFSAWERGVAKIDRVISAVALPPFVHRAIHDIALVNGPRFGDREIDAEQRTPTPFAIFEIGRASGRERVCQYVSISVVAGSLKKKKK